MKQTSTEEDLHGHHQIERSNEEREPNVEARVAPLKRAKQNIAKLASVWRVSEIQRQH